MALAPVLTTPRLTLRLHTPSDFEASVKLWQHATTVRYLGGRALTREEVWLRLLRYWGSWAVLGFGLWRVETRNTGEFVGELGFQELKRDSNPSYAGELEVGWVLMPEFHGQGFGRESLAPVLAWGDAHLDVPRMVCIIHPDNRASLKLASAFGFTPKYDLEYKGGPMTLFERVIAQEAPQR